MHQGIRPYQHIEFPFSGFKAHVKASTNDHQAVRESSTPSFLPDLKSIPENDFNDKDELLNPVFYHTWRHGQLHMNYTPV